MPSMIGTWDRTDRHRECQPLLPRAASARRVDRHRGLPTPPFPAPTNDVRDPFDRLNVRLRTRGRRERGRHLISTTARGHRPSRRCPVRASDNSQGRRESSTRSSSGCDPRSIARPLMNPMRTVSLVSKSGSTTTPTHREWPFRSERSSAIVVTPEWDGPERWRAASLSRVSRCKVPARFRRGRWPALGRANARAASRPPGGAPAQSVPHRHHQGTADPKTRPPTISRMTLGTNGPWNRSLTN